MYCVYKTEMHRLEIEVAHLFLLPTKDFIAIGNYCQDRQSIHWAQEKKHLN